MRNPALALAVAFGWGLCMAAPPAQAQFDNRNGSPFFFQPSMPPPYVQQRMDQDRRELQRAREDERRREMARDQQGFQPGRRYQGQDDRRGFDGPRRGLPQGGPPPYYDGYNGYNGRR